MIHAGTPRPRRPGLADVAAVDGSRRPRADRRRHRDAVVSLGFDRAPGCFARRNTIDPSYIAALESMAAEAEAEVERLRTEIERLHASRPVSEPDPKAVLYGQVGLNPAAPEWLILAARRAYRTQLHPDRHPAHRKREAERRFVLAEQVFDEIATRSA